MARWRGIFGRKGNREGDPGATPTASTDSAEDPLTALYPTTEGRGAATSGQDSGESAALDAPESDPYSTEDWEQIAEPDTGAKQATGTGEFASETEIRTFEPDTGTADWAPPSPVFTHPETGEHSEQPSEPEAGPEPEAEAEPEPMPEAEPERIQAAADEAAQAAEMRSHEEIVALEADLAKAKANAKSEIEDLVVRLRESEARAGQAEEEAARLSEERDEVEARAREAATKWLRQQVIKLKAEAQKRVREEVGRIRAEAEGGPGDSTPAVAGAEAEGLRSELKLAQEEAESRIEEAHDVGRQEALESQDEDLEGKLRAAKAGALAEVEAELERQEEPRRLEVEQRALAAAESKTADRIARAQADAEERIHAEVAVARKAAEERFAEILGERERELQTERESKASAIEQSHTRLSQIEKQAAEAAERVGLAESNLEAEKLRLQKDSAAQLEVAIKQAQAVAEQSAAERLRDREEELTDALAATAGVEGEAVAKVEAAEARERAAEERARAVEAEAAATISEVRQAAADWLRDQTKAR